MMKKSGFFNNKKGQGLSVNAIILIILGLVVLVALILGFTLGFQGLKDIFSTNNVGTIASACQTACATNAQYDFCTSPRDLKADNGVQIKDSTCLYLAEKRLEFGVSKCAEIICSSSVLILDSTASGLFGLKKYPDQTALTNDNVCGKAIALGIPVATTNTDGKTVYGMSGDEKISTLLSKTCSLTP